MPPIQPSWSRFLIETIPDHFYAALERDSPVALAHRVDGRFLPISHRELQARVERLALALRGELISDFPLCNKSFNLSYCGHDL